MTEKNMAEMNASDRAPAGVPSGDPDGIARSCIDCGSRACDGEAGAFPEFCATTGLDPRLAAEVTDLYLDDPENSAVAKNAALIEAEYYCEMTRVEEIAEFARRMGFEKIGIATCVGLLREARAAAAIFRAKGFTVHGAACKAGAQPKASIGIDPKCDSTGVNMCNPILQAKLLARENTDLNVVIGLCVGHDSLFYKYSEALTTTLVVKDRVLAHNPCAALYQTNSYYSKLLEK